MSGPKQRFATDYIAQTIADALARLPTGTRGPKTSLLRTALAGRTNFDECWPWPGRIGQNGYGIATRPVSRTGTSAHRLVWEVLYGPVRGTQQVDHLCHDPALCRGGNDCPHRRCVNPTHLALATPQENTHRSNAVSAVNARKTHCHKGHEFSPDNTYIDPHGRRACRTCQRAHWRRYYLMGKGAVA